MNADNETDLAARVAALEGTVAELERRLAASPSVPPPHARTPDRQTLRAERSPPFRRALSSFGLSRSSITLPPTDPGQWVNRLGIALLLLGAAFGFKYSIDRGWIGPALRVLFGLGLGAALVIASGRVRGARPGLSRVLAGGGIASAYLSIYAAFQLYILVSQPTAFVAMSMVTAAAFLLGMRDDEAMTATVATIGGLATPFLLYSGDRSVGGLVLYTCLVVASAGAVFVRCGWRALLWTATFGGWLVLASAAWQVRDSGGTGAIAAEFGILFLALATWWLAVMREMWLVEDPVAWKPTSFGFADGAGASLIPRGADWVVQTHQLTLGTPILVLVVSSWAWDLKETASGWLAASLAIGWSGAALHLRSMGNDTARRLGATHGVAAAVMLAFAMSFLFGDDARRFGLAAEALGLLALGARASDSRSTRLGHLFFLIVGIETYNRIMDGIQSSTVHFGAAEMTEFAVLVCLAVGALVQPVSRDRYLLAAEGGLLMWLLSVLGPLPNGAACVTAAWFVNAVALIIVGLRRNNSEMRTAGAAVMGLTMGKLFLFDMATVDAGWRIVTFVGFGAALLALGYAFPALWGREESPRK